jgi:RHS repeat-associated protein
MQKMGYSYGFNGMEKDDEVKGEGISYTTFFRLLDPRVGRWLSLDPLMAKFPYEAPYVAFHNNPIFYTDPGGDDPPEELFKKISKVSNASMRKSWNSSFISKETKKGTVTKVKEIGGTIIQKVSGDNIEYQVINTKVSRQSDMYVPDYSNVPSGWEVAGEYHTHPYSERELSKDWKGTGWDGLGMPFSDYDFRNLSMDSELKNNFVSLVESGDKRYGIVVTDKHAFKQFVGSGKLDLVYDNVYEELYKSLDNNTASNLDESFWNSIKSGFESYGDITGVKLFEQNIVNDAPVKTED